MCKYICILWRVKIPTHTEWKMNQYWSLDGLLLVSDSYQYWSEA